MQKANLILKALSSSGKINKAEVLLRLSRNDGENYVSAMAVEYHCSKAAMFKILHDFEVCKLVYITSTGYAKIKTYHLSPFGLSVLKDLAKWDYE